MSGLVHDFSIASIDELEVIAVKKVDEEDQWGIFDWFEDTVMTRKLNIHDNLDDLTYYHETMMDKYNIGKKKLKSIIKDVTFVDETHKTIWQQINTELDIYLNKLKILDKIITPSNLAYISAPTLKTYLNKVDEKYDDIMYAADKNIQLLNQYIEQELYPPEWWESLLSGLEGFVVSGTRNLIFEPLYGIADFIGFKDFARNGVQGMDNIEAWLREHTFDENAYLTGSKIGEVFSIIAGLCEFVAGISMLVAGIAGEIGGGFLMSTGFGVILGGGTMALSTELILTASGIMVMGAGGMGSGINKFSEPVKNTDVDLENLKELDDDLPSFDEGASGAETPKRPSWRQSETDAQKSYPDYEPQKSFKNGQEVPYGTKGSTRPELYKQGHSIEVKNYNVETPSGQNNLVNNVSKQIQNRTANLPSGTKQTVIVDVRGQTVSNEVLKSIRSRILEKSGIKVEIIFKR